MYNENQIVEVKWANKTRAYYERIGYIFTKYGDTFHVVAKDLPHSSMYKIHIICDFCGEGFQTTMRDYYRHEDKNIDACKKCRANKQHSYTYNDRANKKFNLLKDFCSDMNYELITKETDYSGAKMEVEYICPKHGKQTALLDNMIHGHGCLKCSYESRGVKSKHDIKYIKDTIESFNGNELLNPEDYVESKMNNLKIKCGSCGQIYTVSFSDYVNNQQIRCSHCSHSESKGERRIRLFLESNNIQFQQRKSFKDCKDIKPLPFDFFLPDRNLIIEFDGQHHFYPVWGFKHYFNTVKHDLKKNDYCNKHNIQILRIPYWDGNDIEKILQDALKIQQIDIDKRYSLVS